MSDQHLKIGKQSGKLPVKDSIAYTDQVGYKIPFYILVLKENHFLINWSHCAI